MPASAKNPVDLIATTTPVVAVNSSDQPAFAHDHIWLYVDFTLGSLTSVSVALEFAYWDSSTGPVWDAVYDAKQTQVEQTFTSSFDGWVLVSSPDNNSRMNACAIAARYWRVAVTFSGTNTSSSIAVKGLPYSVGSVRE